MTYRAVCTRLPLFVGLLLAGLLLIGLLPAQVQAQEVVEDTLDWHRYYPLQIGNQWQYESSGRSETLRYRYHIPHDTLISERAYFVLTRSAYYENGDLLGTTRDYVRYSDNGAHLVEVFRQSDGTFSDEKLWGFAPCGLDAPFETDEPYPCSDTVDGGVVHTSGGYGGSVTISPDTVEVAAVKFFDTLSTSYTIAADIGIVGMVGDASSEGSHLVYAHLAGEVFGQPDIPTDAKRGDDVVSDEETSLVAYPNPMRDVVNVAYTISRSQRIQLEVFNILGRRVFAVDLGFRAAGEYRYEIRGSSWTTGTYFLRLKGSQGGSMVHSITKL